MKAIIVASLLALSFTTGFTCSKNQPADTTTTQEQMAAPTEATPAEGTPADGMPADGAPTEETPAETK